jgi:NitT/TauT family transport system ATP-binding protein
MLDNPDYIVAKNITKAYKTYDPILLDLSLSIKKGKFICLFGPNGCGKTTFLTLLSGIDTNYEGEIYINGHPPQQAKVGIVPQHCEDTLLPWRKVIDNIALGLELDGMNRHEREERVRDFIQRTRISLPLGFYPHQISGGQQQLTAILQALIQQPEFLILDEPFSALDFRHANDIQNRLNQLWELTTTTVIFTTHDLFSGIHFADQVFILSPRPAHVILQFEVSLPRPRLRRDPNLLELYDDVHHKYLSLSVDK